MRVEAPAQRNFTVRAATLLLIVFTCLLWTPSVFGVTTYSDTWLNDSDPTDVRVTSSGVTVDNTNYANHTYWVVLTLTSPSGRTSTSTSWQSQSYTRAETSLPMATSDSLDLGDYSSCSEHRFCCPQSGGNCYTSNIINLHFTIGASVSVLTKAAMSNTYTIIANCNVHCPVEQLVTERDEGQYVVCAVPWVYYGGYQCAPVSLNYKASIFDNCFDVTGTVTIPGIPF